MGYPGDVVYVNSQLKCLFPCTGLEKSPNQNCTQESKYWDGFTIMVSFTSIAVTLIAAGAGVVSAPAATYFWSFWTDGKSKITQNNGPDGKFSVKWSGDKGNFVLGKGWNTGSSRSFNLISLCQFQANPPPEKSLTRAPSSQRETATSPSTAGPPTRSSNTTSSRRTATTTPPTTPRPR